VQVLDRETGQVIEVPESEIADGVRSGRFGLRKGTTVPVVGPDGRIGTVAAEEAAEAFNAGFAPTTRDAVRRVELEAKHGSAGQMALTGAEGFARGLSLGTSDPILTTAFGDEYRQEAAGRRETNPITAIGGEITGAVAPVLATRGGAAPTALRTVGMLPRGVAAAGRATESAVARMVGTGATSTIGRAAQRVAPRVAGELVEGAAYGAGQSISEAALGNHELTAEKILTSVGQNAILGGLAGGILTGGGALASAAGRKIASGASDALAVVGKRAPGEGNLTRDAMELFTGKKFDTATEALDDFARTRALKSTGGLDAHSRAFERLPGAYQRRAGEMMLTDLPKAAKHKSLASMSRSQINAAAEKVNKQAGKQIGESLKSIDDTIARDKAGKLIELQPDTIAVVQKARKVVDELRDSAGAGSLVKKFDKYLDDLLEKGTGASFQRLHKQRQFLDTKIAWAAQAKNPSHKTWKAIRAIVEDEIETKAAIAARELGLESTYKAAKQDYAASKWIIDASARGVRGEATNRTISLGDHGFGILGGLVGGSLGPVAAMAGAAASAATSNLIRNRGDQVTAALVHRLAQQRSGLGKVAQISTSIDRRLETGVGKYLSRVKETGAGVRRAARHAVAASVSAATRDTSQHTYDRTKEQVELVQRNPDAMRAAVQRSTRNIAAEAPMTAKAIEDRSIKSLEFLALKMPQPRDRGPLLGPSKDISAQELSKFARYVDAVENPLKIIDELQDGTLSPETVEAVRETRPLLYQQIQTQVLKQIQSMEQPPAYTDRIQLGLLLDIPTDPTLEPEIFRILQDSYTPPKPPPPSRQPSGGALTSIADNVASATERLESL
jgi:hypothetical protein